MNLVPTMNNVSWILLVWSLHDHWWPWLEVSQFCHLKPSGFLSHHASTLWWQPRTSLLVLPMNTCLIWSPAAYGTVIDPLLPWNVPLLAFRIPAPHAFVHFSFPCPQHPLLALSLSLSLNVDVPQGLTFTLSSHSTYSEQFWESHVSVFTQSVWAPRFQVLSRTVLFNIVFASHTWLFKLKILK